MNLLKTLVLTGIIGIAVINGAFAQLTNTTGTKPFSKLVLATDGQFYGTNSEGGQYGYGTIFRVSSSGVVQVLHSFSGFSDGGYPLGGLIQASDGNFYGTTSGEPTYSGGPPAITNPGTVFQLSSTGVFTTLFTFSRTNGATPEGTLLEATDGNLYGTTASGGSSDYGTVFKITKTGTFTSLASFNGTNGINPSFSGVIQGADGNLYGTTFSGKLFETSTSGGGLTIITSGLEYPTSGVIQGSDGNFYGVSSVGYAFKVTPTGTVSTLASFSSTTGPYGGLIQSKVDGNFYGTTASDGGYGTVFRLTPTGTLTTLASFDLTNGSNPCASLIQDSSGNLYGTTTQGAQGGGESVPPPETSGFLQGIDTVFKVSSSGTLSTLASFGIPPTISPQPIAQVAVVGNAATLASGATGTAPLSYQWQKNGSNVSGATSASYTISSVASGDLGNYSLGVTGPTATASSEVVSLIPVVSQPVFMQTVVVGQPASLSINVPGSGLTYQWQFNGTNISGATSATYTIPTSATSNSGVYDVVIGSGSNSFTSPAYTLTVNPPFTPEPTMPQWMLLLMAALLFFFATRKKANVAS